MCSVSGMENLASYLDTRGISQREFARLLDVDPSIVSRLVHGQMRPGLELAFRIERLTKGRIKAASWVPADEKTAVCCAEKQVTQKDNARGAA